MPEKGQREEIRYFNYIERDNFVQVLIKYRYGGRLIIFVYFFYVNFNHFYENMKNLHINTANFKNKNIYNTTYMFLYKFYRTSAFHKCLFLFATLKSSVHFHNKQHCCQSHQIGYDKILTLKLIVIDFKLDIFNSENCRGVNKKLCF